MNNEWENDAYQISDDDLLYRRFHYIDLRRDGSIAYSLYVRRKPPPPIPDPEISVDLASRTTPKKTLEAAPPRLRSDLGLGILRVGDVRSLGFTVRYQPTQGNNAHCVIEGAETEADCARLADITRVHTLPPRISST